jgi:hypothetical protein
MLRLEKQFNIADEAVGPIVIVLTASALAGKCTPRRPDVHRN